MDSRTKRKMSGRQYPTDTLMLAAMLDTLNILAWQNTKDAQKGRNRPKSVYVAMTQAPPEDAVQSFETGEDFEAYRSRILRS